MPRSGIPIHERIWFTTGEIAEWTDLQYRDVEHAFDRGELKGFRRGRAHRRISRDSAYEFLHKLGITVPGLTPTSALPLILVVEDNPKMRRLIRTHLEARLKNRVRVKDVGSVAEAIEIATETPPHLVILDYVFEGKQLQGDDAIRFLKDFAGTRRTKVVVLTAHSDRAFRDRTLRAGATEFLTKPLPMEQLKDVVVRLLFSERRDQRKPIYDVIV